MIDRKGWAILIACAIALAANFHISQKNAAEYQRQLDLQKKEQAAQAAANPEQPSILPQDTPAAGAGDLAIVREDADPGDQHILETDKVTFSLRSGNGGIEYAELKDELTVGSAESLVRINRYSDRMVGSIVNGADNFIEDSLLIEDSSDKHVTFIGRTTNQLIVRKTYRLVEDQSSPGAPYLLKLSLSLQNSSKGGINLAESGLFLGSTAPLYQREWDQQNAYFYRADDEFETEEPGSFKKGFFSAARPNFNAEVTELEYAGVMNQFFATFIAPQENIQSRLWASTRMVDLPVEAGGGEEKKTALRGSLGFPAKVLSPNETVSYEYDIYMGPKDRGTLVAMGGNRVEVMNYGFAVFRWFANVFNVVLNFLHDVIYGKIAPVYGWGLAIMTLTVLIRICIWPLHNKSQRTMKKMSKLQPEMAKLKEKYADDPNKMNQKTMELYRDFGVNPLGGCLPMFAQIPIFFGFYKMLQFAVELRGEKFLWVDDLSQPDTLFTIDLPFSLPFLGDALPVNLLPVLMAVTMVIQMRMTPQTGDAMQRRIFMMMPLMFFFFCYNFAAALALYWTTQNIFSIGQTALMKRLPEPDLKKAKPGKRKKTLAERVAEMESQKKEMQMRKAKGRDVTDSDKKKKRSPKTGG